VDPGSQSGRSATPGLVTTPALLLLSAIAATTRTDDGLQPGAAADGLSDFQARPCANPRQEVLGVRQGRMERAEDLRRVEESAIVTNLHSLCVCTVSFLSFRFC
jgi:hypothetical protein